MTQQHNDYTGPAGGWGSVKSLLTHASATGQSPAIIAGLLKQNKPDGFACVSCAWAKPAEPHPAEFCENGAKATFWELTSDRATPDFFAAHPVSRLRSWTDHALESAGRLTHPMRYDSASDTYLPVSWEQAFREIGGELAALREEDPWQTVFYTSGRASLETSYMYSLFARLYGNNNLPDSSNMCHETTSVALPESIGIPVGTIRLDDFEATDALFFFGHNTGSNSPRMLHQLQEASRRGAAIVTFNPLRERGLERFTNPQSPLEMVTGDATRISSQYYQVRAGGDIAAIAGLCKALLAEDAADLERGGKGLLDRSFLADMTHGIEDFLAFVEEQSWEDIERESGLVRRQLEFAAATYASAKSVIGVYGMGLTQHKYGVAAVQMLVNLLLLRGNMGRPGAGILPVRGHSNVQGQRTVGITEKVSLAPNDKLRELYGFEPPDRDGVSTVDACRGIIDGTIRAFVGLGGNFLRAVPERDLMEEAWPRMRLTVQVATKLNRSHLFNGDIAYLLPCLGRTEIDEQAGGPQTVTMEDSTACFHASVGFHAPASPQLLSETRIVAEIAKHTLLDTATVPWDEWVGDYGLVRRAIERTYPAIFKDLNARMHMPGGVPRPLAARERIFNTDTGRANFKLPPQLSAASDEADTRGDALRLITLRSNDQFNTTVYGYDDRFRGISGTRMVVLLGEEDCAALSLVEGDVVALETAVEDGIARRVDGLTVMVYDIPRGCCAGYYPELNALIPLWLHAEGAKVPAAKSVPVRIVRA